jgi:spermidine synthase
MPHVSLPAKFALALCFILSGAAGLVYETTWTRQLGYHFSGTAFTSSLVLTAFMGGMAIGSYAAGRVVGRLASPLKAYAYLELALAACGIAYPHLIDRVGAFYVELVRRSGGEIAHPFAIKFAMFVSLLAVPAVLMGATLPLVVQLVASGGRRSGRGLGLYYAVNAGGGVLGCAAAGFYAIETFGLTATSNAGALANAAAFVLALVAERMVAPAPEPVAPGAATPVADPSGPAPAEPAEPADEPCAPRVGTLAIVLFVSGFTAMAYEVLWAKILPLILGSSTYSFALMLATFVFGVTAGSLAYAALADRLGPPERVVACSQAIIGLWVILTVPLYGLLPYPFLFARVVFGLSFPVYQATALVLNACVMLVPAVLFGVGFPAAVAAARPARGTVGRSVGNLYAANTAGNVAGSLAAGLALIPGLGAPLSFQTMALFNLVAAWSLTGDAPRAMRRAAGASLALALIALAVPASRGWLGALSSGGFSRVRTENWTKAAAMVSETAARRKPIELIEDGASTIAVTREGDLTSLWTNGKCDASTSRDMSTQMMLGLLGLMMHPDPKDIYVVGLGSGVTAGAALASDRVKSVDCAEISLGVALASRWFADFSGNPVADPRFKLVIDDGRHHLQTRAKQYDVVVVEPSNPWLAGMTNLFTREFFLAARERLKADGLLVQWVQLYETDDQNLGLVMRTLLSVFPHVRAFQYGTDLLMVAAMDPRQLEPAVVVPRMVERSKEKMIAEWLTRVEITTTLALLGTERLSTPELRRFAGRGVLLTDDHPELEFTAPVAYYAGSFSTLAQQPRVPDDGYATFWLAGRKPDATEIASVARLSLAIGMRKGVPRFIQKHRTAPDLELSVLAAEGLLAIEQPEAAMVEAREAVRIAPDDVRALSLLARAARQVEEWALPVLARDRFAETRKALARLAVVDPKVRRWRIQLVAVATRANELGEAAQALESLTKELKPEDEDRKTVGELWLALARDLEGRGMREPARAAAQRARALLPDSPLAAEMAEELPAETAAPVASPSPSGR